MNKMIDAELYVNDYLMYTKKSMENITSNIIKESL